MYRIDKKSEAVKEIQAYLREIEAKEGVTPKLAVDGVYGEETRASVRAFQRREGLIETGEVDKETFELLYAAYLSALEEKESALIPAILFPLRMGDSGSYVRILQAVLNEILSLRIPPDAFFGRATENGVRAAEARYGIGKSLGLAHGLAQHVQHKTQGGLAAYAGELGKLAHGFL